MSGSGPSKESGSGPGLLSRFLGFCILTTGLLFLCVAGAVGLGWRQQTAFALVTVLIAIMIDRIFSSYLATLTLTFVSMYSTFRYAYWRYSTTVAFFSGHPIRWTLLDAFFICLLLGAETYAFIVLFLGYMQTVWPLRRTPIPLPDDPEQWPEVDLLIPTCNEPLSIVRYTALAALNIDWPVDKLNIHILDDGRRDEFRAFAKEAGIGYITRENNKFAKAGNINRALRHLQAPFVAIFDCDHVPTRSFLQVTMGWFLRDSKLGMLQTPHHFYSADPFERNLAQFRVIPNETELFYGIVQDGNDFWNATFFCGSCAVLRRSALDESGGIAVETVTEDAHTSLRMQMNGWNTAYINIPQAAGLATETLSGHVRQRIRWARGMVQILRIDNPLFAKGLRLAQRLCYFNAMWHFLYALPRLVFLIAPLIYLVFGQIALPGYWAAILAYAAPHLILASLTSSRIQGQHRHSFWNEVYEAVLAPYILIPTLLALINPKSTRFNVTAKGGIISRRFFDARIALPFLVMLAFDMIGLLMGAARYFRLPVPLLRGLFDPGHHAVILLNIAWNLFNMVILGVCAAVSWESQQRRATVRVTMAVAADLTLAGGSLVKGVTADISTGGVQITVDRKIAVKTGDAIELAFAVSGERVTLPATVVGTGDGSVRARFERLTLEQEESLTMLLFGRADTWLGWGEAREIDRPMRSLGRILRLSMRGFTQVFKSPSTAKPKNPTSIFPVIVGIVALAWLFGSSIRLGRADRPLVNQVHGPRMTPAAVEAHATHTVAEGQFDNVSSLWELSGTGTIHLSGRDGRAAVRFSLPETEAVKNAKLHLRYQFSPGLTPASSYLKVSLNGTLFATIPVPDRPASTLANDENRTLEATVTMPAGDLVHTNELTLAFAGHSAASKFEPWVDVEKDSSIEVAGTLLTLENELKQLPLPLYDAAVDRHPSVTVVFLSQPSPRGLEAAGIVASWFGILAGGRPVHFPVSVGMIPPGNAIVIAEDAEALPEELNLKGSSGPMIAMRSNPVDPYAKLLVLSGDQGGDLVKAATALTRHAELLRGDQVPVSNNLITPEPLGLDGSSGSAKSSGPFSTEPPDLALFADTGLPFTAMAGLSDTAVVLPSKPAPDEIELFLTLMGRFGVRTGYSALNITVTTAAEMDAGTNKDYLILGTVDDQPAIRALDPHLPVVIERDGLHIQDTRGFFAPFDRMWRRLRPSGQRGTVGGLPDAVVEAVHWPRGSGRSVVLIALRDRSGVPGFLAAFLNSSRTSGISGSVSVLRDGRFSPYPPVQTTEAGQNSETLRDNQSSGHGLRSKPLFGKGYSLGSLWLSVNVLFSRFAWAFAIAVLLASFLMAIPTRAVLRRRARTRLIAAR